MGTSLMVKSPRLCDDAPGCSQATQHPLQPLLKTLSLLRFKPIMYSVLRAGASTSFLLPLLFCVGCGSSSPYGPPPEGLPIESSDLSESEVCLSSEQISSVPPVYRCKTESGVVFVSNLKDCSVSEKFSFQATTRQLFVGLTGLTILSQEPVSFGDRRALQTLVSGTLDAQPIAVSTFTFRDGECVTDVVVWRAEDRPLASTESSGNFSRLSQSIAEHIVGESMEPLHGEG